MSGNYNTPFDSIEGTEEYMALLDEAIREALAHVESDLEAANANGRQRHKEALDLTAYKLHQLSTHVTTSRRILNDLRLLRRLLLMERSYSAGAGD